jgi:hypothetical protein
MPRLLSLASVERVFGPRSSVFFNGALQPLLDQMQHAPVNDAARQRLQQFSMGMLPK